MSAKTTTVLIADDDPDQLAIRSLLLRHEGFSVIGGHSTAEALAVASANAPDLALIDVNLPRLSDGFELIRELKARYPIVRIIILTGFTREKLQSHPEMRLVDQVITKATPTQRLIDALRVFSTQ